MVNKDHIEAIVNTITMHDKSYLRPEFNYFWCRFEKYSMSDLREAYKRGIEIGVQEALQRASIEGQIIELTSNTTNPRHKRFLQEFNEMCDRYRCGIQYHYKYGMLVVDLDPKFVSRELHSINHYPQSTYVELTSRRLTYKQLTSGEAFSTN